MSVSLTLCLSDYVSLSLFVSHLCVSQSCCLSACLSLSLFVSQSVCCSVCLSLSQCVSHQRACQSNNKVGDSQYCILLAGDRLTVNLRSETANNFVPLGCLLTLTVNMRPRIPMTQRGLQSAAEKARVFM